MKKISTTPFALCGAKTRNGVPCQNWGMTNGRCRMHGGESTRASTPEGLERIRQANWIHGQRSAQGRKEQREFRELLGLAKESSREVNGIEEEALEGSKTLDELNRTLDKFSAVQSKLKSHVEKCNYLTTHDLIAVSKYYQSEVSRVLECRERILNRQKR